MSSPRPPGQRTLKISLTASAWASSSSGGTTQTFQTVRSASPAVAGGTRGSGRWEGSALIHPKGRGRRRARRCATCVGTTSYHDQDRQRTQARGRHASASSRPDRMRRTEEGGENLAAKLHRPLAVAEGVEQASAVGEDHVEEGVLVTNQILGTVEVRIECVSSDGAANNGWGGG